MVKIVPAKYEAGWMKTTLAQIEVGMKK